MGFPLSGGKTKPFLEENKQNLTPTGVRFCYLKFITSSQFTLWFCRILFFSRNTLPLSS
jgi:hypothetical protein